MAAYKMKGTTCPTYLPSHTISPLPVYQPATLFYSTFTFAALHRRHFHCLSFPPPLRLSTRYRTLHAALGIAVVGWLLLVGSGPTTPAPTFTPPCTTLPPHHPSPTHTPFHTSAHTPISHLANSWSVGCLFAACQTLPAFPTLLFPWLDSGLVVGLPTWAWLNSTRSGGRWSFVVLGWAGTHFTNLPSTPLPYCGMPPPAKHPFALAATALLEHSWLHSYLCITPCLIIIIISIHDAALVFRDHAVDRGGRSPTFPPDRDARGQKEWYTHQPPTRLRAACTLAHGMRSTSSTAKKQTCAAALSAEKTMARRARTPPVGEQENVT